MFTQLLRPNWRSMIFLALLCCLSTQHPLAKVPMEKRMVTHGNLASPLSEDFESGTKPSYTAGTVQFTSGVWFLNNALIGTLATDQKDGSRSVRIRNTGSIRMDFDYTDGASTIIVKHAAFG